MRIARQEVRDALFLSPMVDVTDAAFRHMARVHGADVTCSEMVSAAGIVHDHPGAWRLVRRWPGERPYGVQLMGGDAAEMSSAVAAVCERVEPDFVDLNLGCPSPHILRSCAGGFLLRDPAQAGRVIAAAVAAAEPTATPVSVKMRLGHDDEHRTYRGVADAAAAAGAAWCTLHGRTVVQGYSGAADWDAIARLVEACAIPVVGNGDLRGPDDVVRMRDATGCAGFFIARAAMHDPTVFGRMRAALDGRAQGPPPALADRLALALQYLDDAAAFGQVNGVAVQRQAVRLVAGVPGAKDLRRSLHDARDASAVRTCIADALASLEVAALHDEHGQSEPSRSMRA